MNSMLEALEYDIIPMKHVTNNKHSILRNKLVGKKQKKSTTLETTAFVRTLENIHFI